MPALLLYRDLFSETPLVRPIEQIDEVWGSIIFFSVFEDPFYFRKVFGIICPVLLFVKQTC